MASSIEQLKVCLVGSGNWGSAVAKIIGNNVTRLEGFSRDVTMYVYEEIVDGEKLSEVINSRHENVKYLPGIKLPTNVRAEPDLVSSASNADILVFVVPHQFVPGICAKLKGSIKPGAVGVSLIKGLDANVGGKLELVSETIASSLQIPMSVLMGANIATEVAQECHCEATLGCKNSAQGSMLKRIFSTDYFKIEVVDDLEAVEMCGALKNVVACAAGFADGMDLGSNTKAAIIRIGLVEMMSIIKSLFPDSKKKTYFQSCGVADLITTCFGGRNRRISEAFVRTGKSLAVLEAEMLNGQKLQGPATAQLIYKILEKEAFKIEVPLFVKVYQICFEGISPRSLLEIFSIVSNL
ncbi:Glycerol-3-phosphate dehydrogenase, cytoplasmic [Oopsacas minuta]|uniref:Glycerol-3-phosphate dehydrogenase [NAD(+)] n=1 Tax=Oopsacas minuta TaxID=111878 RepID=A0AAV7KIQ4_9METZ|nr:Glycerol-3-phosphate dehydrogenase, cytoplasmic [Oopsacas minuta]